MAPWQKLLITFTVVVLASFVAGLLWHRILNTDIPTFMIGVVGGITAAAAWRLLNGVSAQQ